MLARERAACSSATTVLINEVGVTIAPMPPPPSLLPQTSVAVGEPGIQMMDRDEYGLDVLNQILNGFG